MKNSGSPVARTRRAFSAVSGLFISLLIFLSVIPLASAEVWFEAAILTVIFLLSAAAVWFDGRADEIRRLSVPLVLLAVYSLAQGLAGVFFENDTAWLPQSFDPAASLWNALKIFGFALFLGLLAISFRHRAQGLIWILISTGFFFAVFGILRFLFQESFPGLFAPLLSPQLEAGRGFGTFFNQNHFATLMLMAFGLSIGLLRCGQFSLAAKLYLICGAVIAWTAIVLTASRGGIISSFAAIAVLIFLPLFVSLRKGKTHRPYENVERRFALVGRQIAVFLVVFGFLVIGVYLIGQDRIVGRFEEISGQIGGVTNAATFRRTDVWQAALGIIRDFPLFGIGFGAFYVAVSQYIDISGQLVPKQVHNDYLEFATSGGLVGVALGAWFLARYFSLLKQRLAAAADTFSMAARVGAICALSGAALHSFFDFSLQIPANLLFFAAVLFISIRPATEKSETIEPPQATAKIFNLCFALLCLSLAAYAVFYGFARRQIESARQNSLNSASVAGDLARIPFDAHFYEAQAGLYERAGQAEAAVAEMKNAIRYRPKDYQLRLRLGRLEQSRNRFPEAEIAFRRAIELAPLFGEPHFLYGDLLVKTNRRTEGFSEIRYAARRNPNYFDEALALVWRETGGRAEETIRILSPLDPVEAERLALFLFFKEDLAGLVRLTCGEENFSNAQRDALVKMLFEKNRFAVAEKIYRRECDFSKQAETALLDGGFENGEISRGTGFGWRADFSDHTGLALDEGASGEGQSLRFDFGGEDDSHALLSQITAVEKNRSYRLAFSYRTSDIVTGGIPMLQVVLKQPEEEITVKEEKFSLEPKAGWIQKIIDFETGPRTEAVEVRLTRQACQQSLCPIFGKLWVDDFKLQPKN